MRNILKELSEQKILFLFSHPDDECYSCVVFIREMLKYNKKIFMLYLSTGIPLEKEYYAPLKNIYSYKKYKELHSKELLKSLELIGIPTSNVILLGYPTRKTALHVKTILQKVKKEIDAHSIQAVFSSPYEGGHPDHDVCSYIASSIQKTYPKINSFEYASYFLKRGKFTSGRFSQKVSQQYYSRLDDEKIDFKRSIFYCYRTQLDILSNFNLNYEVFRKKPHYDYTNIPSSEIYYETWQKNIRASHLVERFSIDTSINSL